MWGARRKCRCLPHMLSPQVGSKSALASHCSCRVTAVPSRCWGRMWIQTCPGGPAEWRNLRGHCGDHQGRVSPKPSFTFMWTRRIPQPGSPGVRLGSSRWTEHRAITPPTHPGWSLSPLLPPLWAQDRQNWMLRQRKISQKVKERNYKIDFFKR